MLVITRRPGESFFIGDEVEVIILDGASQVRIGIDAPRNIEVLRTELIDPRELEIVEECGGRIIRRQLALI